MTLSFFEADGVAIRLAVAIEAGADIETLDGAEISVVAQRMGGGTAEGTAEVDGADLIIRFGPRALQPSRWMIQVRVIPPGHVGITLREPLPIQILRSFSPPGP